MSPRIQAKLLRCLESGEFRPIGGTENKYTDARIIAVGQPERLENPHNVRPDLKSRLCQLSVEILPLREVEKRNAGTIYKIAFILMERYTWTRMFRDNSSLLLTPADSKRYQEKLSADANISRIFQQEWRESNIRELNNFLRQWIVFGDVELDRLSGQPVVQTTLRPVAESLHIYDDALKSNLDDPRNRAEFKALLEKKPLRSLKEAYIRHLYTIYPRIVDGENMTADFKLYDYGNIDKEAFYLQVALQYLPDCCKALVLIAIVCSFITTLESIINWDGGLLTVDIIKTYLDKDGTGRQETPAEIRLAKGNQRDMAEGLCPKRQLRLAATALFVLYLCSHLHPAVHLIVSAILAMPSR